MSDLAEHMSMEHHPGHSEELELTEFGPDGRVVHDVGAEMGLAALRDSPDGVKPYYPYSTLIRYAIKGAPGQRLLLEDIYAAIEKRFPYFQTAPPGWKNSVRHNLSLNPCFEKQSRPLTDRGKGAYWTVNDKIDPRAGIHRDRKKKKKPKKTQNSDGGSEGEAHETPEPGTSAAGEDQQMKDGQPMAFVPAIVDEHGNRVAFSPWPGAYPLGLGARYAIDPTEEEQAPEYDENGHPIWKTIWNNELVKLRRATYEQDISGADPIWYRAMVEGVRAAFLQPEQPYLPAPGGEDEEEPVEGEDGA